MNRSRPQHVRADTIRFFGPVAVALTLGACTGEPVSPREQPQTREPRSRNLRPDLPLLQIAVVGGTNLTFAAAHTPENAIPTVFVERVFEAFPSEARVSKPEIPAESDRRLTANMAGLIINDVARVALSGLQGRDVLRGPKTRQLVRDLARDGLVVLLPGSRSDPEDTIAREACTTAQSYVQGDDPVGPNRLVLQPGMAPTPAARECASAIGATLMTSTSPQILAELFTTWTKTIVAGLAPGSAAPKPAD